MVSSGGICPAGLRQFGVTHDVILVPHSQAGGRDLLRAGRPGVVTGAVLVNTSLPPFFTGLVRCRGPSGMVRGRRRVGRQSRCAV